MLMYFSFGDTSVNPTVIDPNSYPNKDPNPIDQDTVIIDTSLNYNNWKDKLNLFCSIFFLGLLAFIVLFAFDIDIDTSDKSTNHIVPYSMYMYLFLWPLVTLLFRYTYVTPDVQDYFFYFTNYFVVFMFATGVFIPVFGVPYTVLSDRCLIRKTMVNYEEIFFIIAVIIWISASVLIPIFAQQIMDNAQFLCIIFFICLFWHLMVLIHGLKHRDKSKFDPNEQNDQPVIWTRNFFSRPFWSRFHYRPFRHHEYDDYEYNNDYNNGFYRHKEHIGNYNEPLPRRINRSNIFHDNDHNRLIHQNNNILTHNIPIHTNTPMQQNLNIAKDNHNIQNKQQNFHINTSNNKTNISNNKINTSRKKKK